MLGTIFRRSRLLGPIRQRRLLERSFNGSSTLSYLVTGTYYLTAMNGSVTGIADRQWG